MLATFFYDRFKHLTHLRNSAAKCIQLYSRPTLPFGFHSDQNDVILQNPGRDPRPQERLRELPAGSRAEVKAFSFPLRLEKSSGAEAELSERL